MTALFPLMLAALSSAQDLASHEVEPLFERELEAVGTLGYEDPEEARSPSDEAPVWVEVAAYRNPMEALCPKPCKLERMNDHVWTGEAELGDAGAWTADLERGPQALKSNEPIPPVELEHDFALRVTAQVVTTPERCAAFCAGQARVAAARTDCSEAPDVNACRTGERNDVLATCEQTCTGPTAWALTGTTWITTGRAHSELREDDARMVAPDVELERIVDKSGNALTW